MSDPASPITSPNSPRATPADSAAASPVDELLARLVRDVPDFPEPGVVFKDITPLLADHAALATVVEALAELGRDPQGRPVVDLVAGVEARGFILAAPVALALGVGFVPVRKAGKLPGPSRTASYELEYGQATLELHRDAVLPGQRVLVVDDVLATGGTAAATRQLLVDGDAEVTALAVLIELSFLRGRDRLEGMSVHGLSTV